MTDWQHGDVYAGPRPFCTACREQPKLYANPFLDRPSRSIARLGACAQLSKGNFPHGSTGDGIAHESDIAPSAPSRSNTLRLPPGGIATQVGHATDGSGRINKPDYNLSNGRHSSDSIHDPGASTDGVKGMMKDANSKFGEKSRRPMKKPEHRNRARMDSGALAGDSGPRTSYSGGKGPMKP